ncbi:MAG: hypothetical protein Q9160_004383 [Pyrenula sp. 1 TL-2023]
MGVHQLWTIVAPCGRPIKLEALNQRRLAVDASIWIYQFLKAVRDKEGNVLRNSHIVGFYYRICKLLYHGIKPVFVFDGGAPALKRRVITERRKRREGRRDDAVKTAGRLLAVQMQRRAEEDQQRARESRERPEEEEPLPEDLVYADELGMSTKERMKNRQFRKKDQYHLPDLDVSLEELGGPNDPRVMSHEELEEYAKQFKSGEDISYYDFSKIDFDSPMFTSLPAADRYNILNAKRIRSRLRMGYSKDQLRRMFPDRMAFSKFQMERVRERNELTQRLMNINGMADDFAYQGGRIAGEKGKEYILVQNAAAEGGWALGVVQKNQPIDLDPEEPATKEESDDGSEGDDFEDIPIEGLNRIPRRPVGRKELLDHDVDLTTAAQQIAEKRKMVYEGRKKAAPSQNLRRGPEPPRPQDDNAMFVRDDVPPSVQNEEELDDIFEDVDMNPPDSDDDLQKAIQMSLEAPLDEDAAAFGTEKDTMSDDEMDLQAALAESRKSKGQSKGSLYNRQSSPNPASPKNTKSSGPLPFESLDLGQSMLGKKKAERIAETQSGGFDKANQVKKVSQPLPPWFHAESCNEAATQDNEVGRVDDTSTDEEPDFAQQAIRRHDYEQVIDVDAEEKGPEVIDVDAQSESSDSRNAAGSDEKTLQSTDVRFDNGDKPLDVDSASHHLDQSAHHMDSPKSSPVNRENSEPETHMDDLAERVRVEPPIPDTTPNEAVPTIPHDDEQPSGRVLEDEEPVEWSDSDREDPLPSNSTTLKVPIHATKEQSLLARDVQQSTSSHEALAEPEGGQDSDEDAIFEDVAQPSTMPVLAQEETLDGEEQALANQYLIHEDTDKGNDNSLGPNQAAEASDHYDSESDEELLAGLAAEAEANAQFASELNQRSTAENLAAYEDELKRLRAQQKRDRRDADEVTNNMAEEVQILLGLFGLPYITAPMEAEAQCAELVSLGLVDGVVTDDSDIFLFGGTRVYKNFFNGKKNVELYLASDLEKEYNLTRDKLIASAQILGSDYAEHLKGIGPVKAMEMISEWGTLDSFRDWWDVNQLRPPTDIKSDPAIPSERKKFHKRYAGSLVLPSSWPSKEVEKAYWEPTVDSDNARFEWGVPQLSRLRDFFMATVGWSPQRTDEILVPIVRDMAKREREGGTQANVTRYFTGSAGAGSAGVIRGGGTGAGALNDAGAPTRRVESSRMARALGRLKNRENSNAAAEGDAGRGAANDDAPERDQDEREADADASDDEVPRPKKRSKRGKGAQAKPRAAKKRKTTKAG